MNNEYQPITTAYVRLGSVNYPIQLHVPGHPEIAITDLGSLKGVYILSFYGTHKDVQPSLEALLESGQITSWSY